MDLSKDFKVTSKKVCPSEVAQAARELELALGEIMVGKRKAANIPMDPMAILIQHARDSLTDQAKPLFQHSVYRWLHECFGEEIAKDRVERNHRFLEEALELVQSLNCTAEEAHQLVDYVFSRPVGEPTQETGGVMVTLAALCSANYINMNHCGQVELDRIHSPEVMEKIRAKQAAKPKHSPLPM